MKDLSKLLRELVTNNTGVSSTNFAVVTGVLIAAFSIVNVILMMWADALFKLNIREELIYALAGFMGAVEGVVAVLVGIKTWKDTKDSQTNNSNNNNNNEVLWEEKEDI
jgi:protein-S-isoprenylcysteine O-methyltransferase Ste14